ncbi:MAG: hypothetical protein FWC52_01740 [Candidatus Methanoplasma sp.]|nr:hypothetical protein [Candidatus Methanoplasma sp.]
MEYKGGFFWIPICAAISAACTVVGVVATVANAAGLISDKTANSIQAVTTVVGVATGIASGVGTLWTSTATTATKVLAKATYNVAVSPGVNIVTYPFT